MVWNSGDDDDPVRVIGERLVVAAAQRAVAADGGRGGDAVARSGVDQFLDGSCVLSSTKIE